MRVGASGVALLIGLLAAAAANTYAAAVTVDVLDPRGRAVPGTVIVAVPAKPAPPAPRTANAVMDQLDKAFVPQVLVIRAGTSVSFPNSDAVSHQVYSFSAPKRFELPLYRGQPHPAVLFDQPGIVVLGCNIHDSMTGYIYVADSPWFGMSDEQGRWQAATLPPGDYRITIWNPRFARDESSLEQPLHLEAEQTAGVRFQLRLPVRPARSARDPRIRDY